MIGALRAAWGMFRLMRDSRGQSSWAHTLAIPFTIITMLRWMFSGVTFPLPFMHFTVPVLSTTDAVMMLGTWLAYLSGRELTEKLKPEPPKGA